MSLTPDHIERLARARTDLQMGVPILLRDETSTALVLAAETLSQVRLNDLRALPVQPVLTITSRRAQTLKARAYDGDVARILLPADADAGWIRNVADPARDLESPMKGPLATERDGSAELHRIAVDIVKSARLLPATIVLTGAPDVFAELTDVTTLQAEPTRGLLGDTSSLSPVAAARVPLQVSQAGRVHVFRPEDGGEEHYVVEIGSPDRGAPVLARLHSACFTGDVLGSLKCDCGPQLHAALEKMGQDGAGVLLYLNQEGRGIGLANKMRAYALQDQGFDTVEANHRLGFEDDERDFRIGAELLKTMGFSQVRLMTNNPAKMTMLEQQGLDVTERVPLRVGEGDLNRAYLATKAKKSGHLL